jgi:hypothetical protein
MSMPSLDRSTLPDASIIDVTSPPTNFFAPDPDPSAPLQMVNQEHNEGINKIPKKKNEATNQQDIEHIQTFQRES